MKYQRRKPAETTSMERISLDLRYLLSPVQKLSWMAEMRRSIWKNWVARPMVRKVAKNAVRKTWRGRTSMKSPRSEGVCI